MKVICERCGQIFSYEKQNGVCDKCNFYMQKPIPAPEQESAVQKKLHISKFHMIACVILLILIIVAPCVTVFLTQKEVEYRKQLKEVGSIESLIFQMNEDIQINETALRITECRIVEEWQEFAPEGFYIVSVTYDTENMEWSFGFDTEVYMKLPSNEYIEPVHEYRLAEEVGCDMESFSDIYGVTTEMQEATGKFMFLVPDTVEQAKLAVYYIPSTGDNKTSILEAVYEVELDWRVS